MNKNIQAVLEKKLQRTVENLRKNNFNAHYCQSEEDVRAYLQKHLKKGSVVSKGGSMTLEEMGITDWLKKGDFEYLDREDPSLSPEEKAEIERRSYSADYYLMSSNAVTENGELYNVDGRGNRVSALCYGPEKVIVIAGSNKVVRDYEEAVERVRTVAAPANCVRLGLDNPCTKFGRCCDCKQEKRICSQHVFSAYQFMKNRIVVLLVPEEYGY